MKTLPLLIPLLLTACNTSRPVFFRTYSEPIQGIRYPETIKPYHFGRFVDPNNPSEMHEGHTIYRIEAQPAWNLHSQWTPHSAPPLTNSSLSIPPWNDAVLAEINRQKAITQSIQNEASKLSGSLDQFNAALRESKILAIQNAALREQLTNTQKRLDAIESKLPRSKPE